jgi:hypothetical protein
MRVGVSSRDEMRYVWRYVIGGVGMRQGWFDV